MSKRAHSLIERITNSQSTNEFIDLEIEFINHVNVTYTRDCFNYLYKEGLLDRCDIIYLNIVYRIGQTLGQGEILWKDRASFDTHYINKDMGSREEVNEYLKSIGCVGNGNFNLILDKTRFYKNRSMKRDKIIKRIEYINKQLSKCPFSNQETEYSFSYEAKTGEVTLRGIKFKLSKTTNTKTALLMKIVASDSMKKWSFDEIHEKRGDRNDYQKEDANKIYQTARVVNETIQREVGISDFLIYNMKEVFINKRYLE